MLALLNRPNEHEMPIYEYQCTSCGEVSELVQKFSDPPATECPHCHQHDLKKLVSAAAFHLKGQGWYVTDFKDKAKATTEKAQDKTEKTVDNKDSTTSTAKDSSKDVKQNKSD